jgi:hypothetical protein
VVFSRSKLSWRQLVTAWTQSDVNRTEITLGNGELKAIAPRLALPIPVSNHAPYNKVAAAEPAVDPEPQSTETV